MPDEELQGWRVASHCRGLDTVEIAKGKLPAQPLPMAVAGLLEPGFMGLAGGWRGIGYNGQR